MDGKSLFSLGRMRCFERTILWRWGFVVLFALLCLGFRPGSPAQETTFLLTVSKTVGFNNGSQIRGAFRATLSGPLENVSSVEFQIDGQEMAVVTAQPFVFNFNTTAYAEGWHTLGALVYLTDGTQVSTPTRRFEFVSAQAQGAFFRNFVIPVLAGVFLLVFLGMGIQFLTQRGRKPAQLPLGARRSYGLKGGGICPRCKRPFALHWWSLNLLTGVFDRCEHCGRWGFVRRSGPDALRAAEQAELADAQPEQPLAEKSAEDKLKDLLDQSKFTKS